MSSEASGLIKQGLGFCQALSYPRAIPLAHMHACMYTRKCHTTLKETLQSKGYTIVDEFGCAGFNTNKFLKWFGGINKGRPNAEDLKHAEEFALKLKG